MNALDYVTRLPENTSRARELQWKMENYRQELAQAGSDKERAWRLWRDAADNPLLSRTEKEEIYLMAEMYNDIADEAWTNYEESKREYLELFN